MDLQFPPTHHQPHQNGKIEASLNIGGASSADPVGHRAQPTIFPEPFPTRGGMALLYGLHRFELGGVSLGRYLTAALLLLAALSAIGLLPGRWWGTALWLLLLIAYRVAGVWARRAGYVHFIPETGSAPAQAETVPLHPRDKIPVYVTGTLSVEGKFRAFTMLPGFYRTFANGEHALLCLATAQRWARVASRPDDELGMWYAFVSPTVITGIQWGSLRFGRELHPAIALHYTLTIPPSPRQQREQVRPEILYLATASPAHGHRIFIDLVCSAATAGLATAGQKH